MIFSPLRRNSRTPAAAASCLSGAVLLLTAAIDPKGCVFVKRSDPVLRESDYCHALEFWLRESPWPVVFCENSGYDLKNIRRVVLESARNDVQVLQFDGQDYPRGRGKGYGELRIISYALRHAAAMRDAAWVVKVTGRIRVRDAGKIVTAAIRGNPQAWALANPGQGPDARDGRLVAVRPDFVRRYLEPLQEKLNDSQGYFFEHALRDAIRLAGLDGRPVGRLPRFLRYSGINATIDEPIPPLFVKGLAKAINAIGRRMGFPCGS